MADIGDTVERIEVEHGHQPFRETLTTQRSVDFANFLIINGKWRKIATPEK